MTVRDALNSAMDEEMARDPDVFILGEEVRALQIATGTRPPFGLVLQMADRRARRRWASTRAPTRWVPPTPVSPPLCVAAALLTPCCRAQITRGLLQKYGAERVRDTPITEVSSACWL